ncbi:hypothetical protein GPZ77_34235 (plasmid) [Streptomyces sp. QHH-9511]|uniref:hypothetical protein n=1 Tax=Streptomyces sp. QHH-9511 TaxID=2684468 RepID=UPI0013199A7B|nr:hypothetical protein [Streptomyces sp. QHH-9511]QGZ53291.1 hypothetical protein GPZ77_34235 [Streptomyces sp. QHH-9511]
MTDHDYIAQLVAELERATVFRVPCPGTPYGHFADLLVEKRDDHHGDGWAILRDDNVWTGTRWVHRTALARSDIYRYPDHRAALAEAERIIPEQTVTLTALFAERRHG